MARDFKEKRNPDWKFEKRVKKDDGTWGNHDYSNSEFEEYYKAQGIVPEAEWETFLDVLRATLPTTFRINGTTKFAQDLLHKLQTDLFSHFDGKPIEVEGEQVEPPKFLPWYPGKLAWQFNFSRHQLRKLPELEAIHEFVKRENEAGTLTRQEAVSMVPPLFLDVHPHHKVIRSQVENSSGSQWEKGEGVGGGEAMLENKGDNAAWPALMSHLPLASHRRECGVCEFALLHQVLDMCAAPGSKTFQILEMLHAGSDATPPGLVVANDADMQRCNLLTHQTKRICSPCLLVTNHEGQYFPHVPLLSADPVRSTSASPLSNAHSAGARSGSGARGSDSGDGVGHF
jgi:16S rRNA C967 or C1407 C5-methylase (RsmB/RsmF family)